MDSTAKFKPKKFPSTWNLGDFWSYLSLVKLNNIINTYKSTNLIIRLRVSIKQLT